MVPLRIPHNQADPREGRKSLGIPFGIASCDDDARVRIAPIAPTSGRRVSLGIPS